MLAGRSHARSPLERGVGPRESASSGDDSDDDDEDEALDGYTASRGATFAGSDDEGWLEQSEESGGSPGRVICGGSAGVSSGSGGGDGGGRNSSTGSGKGGGYGGRSSSESSCEFDVSAANPIAVGDLWGDSRGSVALGASGSSRRSAGGGGVGGGSIGGGGGGGGGAVALMSTPERYALRMEILRATVAATVAEVAAETYTTSGRDGGGGFSARSSSTAIDSISHFERDGSRPCMSLPMAGSRSPPRAVAVAVAATAFPGRREPETETDSAGTGPPEEGRRARVEDDDGGGASRRSGSVSSNSEGFVGGLPLAGSRSPPAHRVVVVPGRRQPEYYSDASSSEVEAREASVAAVERPPPLGPPGLSAARVPSPRVPLPPMRGERASRRGRRQQRRREEEEKSRERHRRRRDAVASEASSTAAPAAAAAAGSVAAAVGSAAAVADGGAWASSMAPSGASSLDLYSSLASRSGPRPTGGGDVGVSDGGGGRGEGGGVEDEQQRDNAGRREEEDEDDEKEEEFLRQRDQPRDHRWLIDNYADRGGLGIAEVGGDGDGDTDTYWNGLLESREAMVGRRQEAAAAEAAAGLDTRGNTHRFTQATVTIAPRLRSRRAKANANAKANLKATPKPKPERLSKGKGGRRLVEDAGAGLRSTHFAPGYLGVAWPDPLDGGSGGSARNPSIARAGILTKLEDAAARKMADVEERAKRAQRDRAHRLKRRWEGRVLNIMHGRTVVV